MSKLYKLGWLNPPNKLIQKAKKLFPDDYWDVTTKDTGYYIKGFINVEFVCASYAGWHLDYEAWTHILVLQCDSHRIGVVDYHGENFYPVKRGDIVKFNIDSRHCLGCVKSNCRPFIGLTYDVLHGKGENLNGFTAVPFFRALIHNMGL